MMRRRRNVGTALDLNALASALSRPGQDPRQWISYGTVDEASEVDGETFDPVEFDPDYGPLVNVTLQPSNTPVLCRVAMSLAGHGEAEYNPFITGDEVIVAIPEGDEAASPVIIGRLTNAIDKFPENIAGQDPSKNTFAFKRRRTPYVDEYGSTYMVRVASHGGFFLISDSGAVTLRDGAGGALQMGPDIFGYMEGPTARTASKPKAGSHELSVPGELAVALPDDYPALFQLDLVGRRITLQMDDALFTLNSSKADNVPGSGAIIVNGELTLGGGNKVAQEHVATVEFVLALMETALLNIGAGGGFPALAAIAPIVAAGGIGWSFGTLSGSYAAGLPLAGAAIKLDPVGGLQLQPHLGASSVKTG